MRRGFTNGSGISMGSHGILDGVLKPKRAIPRIFQASHAKIKSDPAYAAIHAGKTSARMRAKHRKITLPSEPFDWEKT